MSLMGMPISDRKLLKIGFCIIIYQLVKPLLMLLVLSLPSCPPPTSLLPHLCPCHNLLLRLPVQPRWKHLQHRLHQVQDQGHGDRHGIIWDHKAALYRWVTVLLCLCNLLSSLVRCISENKPKKKNEIQTDDSSSWLFVEELIKKKCIEDAVCLFIFLFKHLKKKRLSVVLEAFWADVSMFDLVIVILSFAAEHWSHET